MPTAITYDILLWDGEIITLDWQYFRCSYCSIGLMAICIQVLRSLPSVVTSIDDW